MLVEFRSDDGSVDFVNPEGVLAVFETRESQTAVLFRDGTRWIYADATTREVAEKLFGSPVSREALREYVEELRDPDSENWHARQIADEIERRFLK